MKPAIIAVTLLFLIIPNIAFAYEVDLGVRPGESQNELQMEAEREPNSMFEGRLVNSLPPLPAEDSAVVVQQRRSTLIVLLMPLVILFVVGFIRLLYSGRKRTSFPPTRWP